MVRDPAVHRDVIARVVAGVEALGFDCDGVIPSPIRGAKEGNQEFLAGFRFVRPGPLPADVAAAAEAAAGGDDDGGGPDVDAEAGGGRA